MTVKVGIPRALLFYYYFPMWNGFFKALGVEVILSRNTTKGILDKGVRQSVDDACLPVKLFFGHVLDLKDRVDYLFIPRMVSVERKEYICPKFLGLPDMIRYNVPDLPPIIDITVNMSRREKTFTRLLPKQESSSQPTRWPSARLFARGLRNRRDFTGSTTWDTCLMKQLNR